MIRGGIWLGALALVAGLLWWQRDGVLARLQAARSQLGATVSAPPTAPAAATGARARRCNGADGAVVYTNEACPPGTREQPLAGGSLSVLPAARPAEAPASAKPLLRQLAPDADGPTIKERMADRLP